MSIKYIMEDDEREKIRNILSKKRLTKKVEISDNDSNNSSTSNELPTANADRSLPRYRATTTSLLPTADLSINYDFKYLNSNEIEDRINKLEEIERKKQEKQLIKKRQLQEEKEKERNRKAIMDRIAQEEGQSKTLDRLNIPITSEEDPRVKFTKRVAGLQLEQEKKDKSSDDRSWLEGGAFKDGYDFGDIGKTILGTGADITQDIAKGISRLGEAAIDTGAYGIGFISEALGNNDLANNMQEFIAKNIVEETGMANRIANTTPLGALNNLIQGDFKALNPLDFEKQANSSNIENNSILGDKSDNLVQGATQLAGQIALQSVGVPWFVTSGVNSFGSEVENAFNNDATYGEAGVSGLVNAGSEIAFERLSGGISFGGKTLDTSIKKALSNQISNKTLNKLAQFGFEATGEGVEEVLTEITSGIGQKLTYENETTWKNLLASPEAFDRYVESFVGGFILSGGVNSLKLANSIKNDVDYNNINGLDIVRNKDNNSITSTENNIKENIPLEPLKYDNKTNDILDNNIKNKGNEVYSRTFSKDLDKFKSGNYTQDDNIVVLDETPQYLYNKGYDYEQPIVINMDKLNTIMKEPKGNFNGKNQHGITMDIIEQLPKALYNPLNVIKNPKYNNRFVIITELADQYGDNIIVPIEMNTKGFIEGIETDINKINSVYGKENYDLPSRDNIDSYMEQNKNNIVYDIDTYKKSNIDTNHRLQLPSTSNDITNINTSIAPSYRNVNDGTNNYYMQNAENNTHKTANVTIEALPMANSNYDTTAQKYNIDLNNETVKSIKQVTEQRGLQTRYDADLFDNSNVNAIWRTTTNKNGKTIREVVLNPNADTNKTLENVIVHELTHDLEGTAEYGELQSLVLDFNSNKSDYIQARKSLEDTYSKVYDKNSNEFKSLIDGEVTADILGNKLGNQEFINTLNTEKPTVAKKIYNWIVDKLNKLNKMTGYKSEKIFWSDVKNKFENAYKQDYQGSNNSSKYSVESLPDGTVYVQAENNKFVKSDGTKMTPREAYQSLVGTTIQFPDGDNAKIVNRLPNKDMYNELSKRYPSKYNNVKNLKDINNSINENLEELLANSEVKEANIPDYKGRHQKQNITNFDTRTVKFYDGKNAYDIDFSIAILSDGSKIAYAKKYIEGNNDLTQKIKTIETRSEKSSLNQQSLFNSSIPPSKSDVNTTKNSMQENGNNTWQNFLSKNYQNKGRGQTIQDVKLANNTQTMYNNIERESGVNEQIQRKGNARILGRVEQQQGLHEKNKPTQIKKYSKSEYEQWEREIRPISEEKLSREQVKLKNDIKGQYGKDIVFFDGKNNSNGYLGGASYQDINRINIDTNQTKEFGINKIVYHEVMESNILHNVEANKDIIEPAIDKILNDSNFEEQKAIFWQDQDSNIPSDKLIAKDILCDRYAEIKSGEKWDYENVLSQETNMTIDFAIENFENSLRNTINEVESTQVQPSTKVLNPTEISKLTTEDASTTPKLKKKQYSKGNTESSFYSNITEDAGFLNEDLRDVLKNEDNVKYYEAVKNKDTLERAYSELKNNGQAGVHSWFSKKTEQATTNDVAKGWILLKQYQDSGDYSSAVEVAKKMRDIGTKAGQTVQAYNILSRLTPEGMFYYAQSELSEAYNKMSQGKTKKWIDENASKFDLTPEETQFIMDTMEDVSHLEDGYNKKVKLAEIQKVISDKIPPSAGQSIKAWMRISMLFNPKTQVRNVMGNAIITPVNMFSDSVSAGIDKLISKKTGVRTTGNTNLKQYSKGFGKGLYESYNDFKKGINTRSVEGNRFEIGEGKSFKDKGLGKTLNRVDSLLSFMLDAGDRSFYEATFTNSINNQMVLNKSTEVTQDMVDIATNEALQRTWQDNNAYTQTVLNIRRALNGKVGKNKGLDFGIGDVLIPFAKTPANLTKAIVDYSPVGLVKSLAIDARKFKNSLENGQYTPQMQHKFVQNLGKAAAGTTLYVIGYALAEAGILSGEADEDKDVKNFMKNSLGINSYSIKLGDKTFSYDWAQPIATPFAIMTNLSQYNKKSPDANALEKAISAINIGSEQLLEQSFMESINTLFNGNGSLLDNLTQTLLELPSRAVPTFSKQIADMVDSTQRTSFEYNKPVQSAINSVIAKIPIASKSLAPSVDTLGNEIQKYGGDNNLFNVFFNPANMNKGQLSKAGEEIYKVYKEIGDKTIFPRTAPYYLDSKGSRIEISSSERTDFQKTSGKYVETTINGLLKNKDYRKLTSEEKAKVINEIVSDSYSKAKFDVLNVDSKEYSKLRNTLKNVSSTSYYDFVIKTDGLKKDTDKVKILSNAKYTNKEKQALYENYILSSSDKKYPIAKEIFKLNNNGFNINDYLKYKSQNFEADREEDGTVGGKSISGSKKKKVWKYIDSISNASYRQKVLLFATEYKPNTVSDQRIVVNFISELNKHYEEEELKELIGSFTSLKLYKDGSFEYRN